ncbi:MAG: phosphatase PAP2 family protein [Clostridia bacterium]|nr:phosphatase PAP2 family protein [Clostridia bacterium]
MSFLHLLESIRCLFLDKLFLLITSLGEETAFLAIAIIVFWCVSKRDGYYLLSVGFVGIIINQFLKLIFRIPRPWVLDKGFSPVSGSVEEASGYSFPSGHTQTSVGAYGSIAHFTKQRWLKIICIALCVLIPFSRMYLGVHTPLDVITSVIIALILIFAIKPIIYKGMESTKVMYIFLSLMLALSVSYLLFVELFPFPNDIDASNYASGRENAYTLIGCMVGMLVSFPVESKLIKFETSGRWYTQLLKVIIGLALVLGLKELLKLPLEAILPADTIARAVRYFIIVVFSVIIYPLTFKHFKRLESYVESRKSK